MTMLCLLNNESKLVASNCVVENSLNTDCPFSSSQYLVKELNGALALSVSMTASGNAGFVIRAYGLKNKPISCHNSEDREFFKK